MECSENSEKQNGIAIHKQEKEREINGQVSASGAAHGALNIHRQKMGLLALFSSKSG